MTFGRRADGDGACAEGADGVRADLVGVGRPLRPGVTVSATDGEGTAGACKPEEGDVKSRRLFELDFAVLGEVGKDREGIFCAVNLLTTWKTYVVGLGPGPTHAVCDAEYFKHGRSTDRLLHQH